MVVDYRTLRHKASHIVFLESSAGIDVAVFSSLGATMKFLRAMNKYLMDTYKASIHGRNGRLLGYMQNGGITLFL